MSKWLYSMVTNENNHRVIYSFFNVFRAMEGIKMSSDCHKILMAINRTKKQHKVYLYEAQISALNGLGGGSVSENVCAIVGSFLRRIGKQTDYLKEKDIKQINNIRRAIAPCG